MTVNPTPIEEIPYEELDAQIVQMVRVLNKFPGLHTISSCAGHPHPKPGQWKAGTWYVTFWLDPTEDGWATLELLAWAINVSYRGGEEHVILVPRAAAPEAHQPGSISLHFILEGYTGSDPEAAAIFLDSICEHHETLKR